MCHWSTLISISDSQANFTGSGTFMSIGTGWAVTTRNWDDPQLFDSVDHVVLCRQKRPTSCSKDLTHVFCNISCPDIEGTSAVTGVKDPYLQTKSCLGTGVIVILVTFWAPTPVIEGTGWNLLLGNLNESFYVITVTSTPV